MGKLILILITLLSGVILSVQSSAENLNDFLLGKNSVVYRSILGIDIELDMNKMLAKEGDMISTISKCKVKSLKLCIIVNDFPIVTPEDLLSVSVGKINEQFRFMYLPRRVSFTLNNVLVTGYSITILSNQEAGRIIGSIFYDENGNVLLFCKENIVYFNRTQNELL